MNEIDLPTMTPNERRLLLNAEHGRHRRVTTWWLPLLILFLVYGLLGFLAAHADDKIDPSQFVCKESSELADAHWQRVTPSNSDQIHADKRYRTFQAYTLQCSNLRHTVMMREEWYERDRLPARRVTVQE